MVGESPLLLPLPDTRAQEFRTNREILKARFKRFDAAPFLPEQPQLPSQSEVPSTPAYGGGEKQHNYAFG